MDLRITDYGQAHQALCSPHLKQSLYDAGGVIMQDTLLTLHGEHHTRRRHLALRVFRRDYARHYEREVFPRALRDALEPLRGEHSIDAVAFGHAVSMNLTADFAGIDRADDPRTTAALQRLTRKFGEGATLVHSTRDHDQVRAEVSEALAEYRSRFLEPSIARRERLIAAWRDGQIPEDSLPRDMLTVLLIDRGGLDDDGLAREIAFYLQAGAHSTSNAFAHALWEVLTWIGSEADRRSSLAGDALATQRAVHEALRLHPASPVAWRRAVERLEFGWGLRVAPEDHLVVDIAAANRDPAVFGPEPDAFRPGRPVLDRRANPFGLTFGIGVHNCLGRDIDAGLPQDAETDADAHQYGTVTLLVHHFLSELDAMFDPADPPAPDEDTSRPNWGRFPVRVRWQP
ncbi:MAG: cytochrome P450 [Pseudomonadales bacterium]|nr:cytochrome P450 [Pseudomonadales bacterium]NIX09831.1 cytochrome P450 [Pseudomonadales bacterium]